MFFWNKERKAKKFLMKIFDSPSERDNEHLPTMNVEKLSENCGLNIEETYVIIQKFVAERSVFWRNQDDGDLAAHTFYLYDNGYIKFKNEYKRLGKKILLVLAASGPFVTILIAFWDKLF